MDWETRDQERENERAAERTRLLAIGDNEAEGLPTPERYQRMRYLREIEAAKWLADLRRTLPIGDTGQSRPVSQRYRKATKVVYERD
jgi:hypothetical protein